MDKPHNGKTTPESIQSLTSGCNPGSGKTLGSGDQETMQRGKIGVSQKSFTHKQTHKIGTLNIRTLIRPGKLFHLTETLEKEQIKIVALQETRFTDEHTIDQGNYRIIKGKPAQRITKAAKRNNLTLLGTAFAIHKSLVNTIIDFQSPSNRLSILSIKSTNKTYTFINTHAPINNDNRTNPEKVETFWNLLEKTMNEIPKKHTKVLLGDFNAQIGKERKHRWTVGNYPGHKRTNRNGERLIEICNQFNLQIMSTYFRRKARQKKTWVSNNKYLGEFQIDHVAISRENKREIQNTRSRRTLNIDSDHYLLEIKIKPIAAPRKKHTPRNVRLEAEIINKNAQQLQDTLTLHEDTPWEEAQKTIRETAQKLGQRKRKPKHRWWTLECDEAIENRGLAWKKWLSNKSHENWQIYHTVQKQTNKTIRQQRRKYEKETHQKLNEDFRKNNTRDFYKTFKQELSRYNPPTLHFQKPDGKLAFDNDTNLKLLRDYFQNLLNCEQPKETLKFKQGIQNPNSTPPTREEVLDIIKSLANNKAAGEDGIIAEVWKSGGTQGINYITRLLEQIWETEKIPTEWKSAIICPIHKKGPKTVLNNYRGISLLPVTYKILSRALLTRLEEQTDHQIGEYQAGFRRNRSCSEQIVNLKNIINIRRIRNKPTTVVFVDFMKAYDSVDRKSLINSLKEFGVDQKTTRLIEQTLTDTKAKVRFQGELSEAFEIKTGLRQGDGLSPLLFNLLLEKIIREVGEELDRQKIKGVTVGRSDNYRYLAFADDIALLAENTETAQKMTEILHDIASKTGLQISYSKTKYMTPEKTDITELHTEQGKINRTKTFKYLGEWIQPNGGDRTSNIERKNKIQKLYWLTANGYNKRSISQNAKISHYNAVVKPAILYATECSDLHRKGELQEIEKAERRIMRKILGPKLQTDSTYRIRPNNEIYQQTEKITTTMKKRRLQFFGHIRRMDRGRLTYQITDKLYNLKATTNWIKEIKKDLNEIQINEQDIQDRPTYRRKIDQHKFEEHEIKTRTGTKWTEERKKMHSRRMKEIWGRRKTQKNHMR